MIVLLLVVFIVALGYCISVLRWPLRPCRRCGGKGTNPGSNQRRYGTCKSCAGTRQVRRFGASAVHRFWWSVLGSVMHERRKERVKKARKRAGYPEL